MSLSSVDVTEVFSPARFTQLAGKFGLRPGIAVDLEEFKDNGETKWDLDKEEDVQEVHAYIDREDPYLLTGGPPCETFSMLYLLSRNKRDPALVAKEQEYGKSRLRTAVSFYKRQMERGFVSYMNILKEHQVGKSQRSWSCRIVKMSTMWKVLCASGTCG